MNHTDAVLSYLKRGKVITPMSALRVIGTMRLAARIWYLRQMGYQIGVNKMKLSSGKQVAQYFLEL